MSSERTLSSTSISELSLELIVAELQDAIERAPETQVTVDLNSMTFAFGSTERPVMLPAPARESFLAGTWDATALLLDRFEEVEQTAKRLPYIVGY